MCTAFASAQIERIHNSFLRNDCVSVFDCPVGTQEIPKPHTKRIVERKGATQQQQQSHITHYSIFGTSMQRWRHQNDDKFYNVCILWIETYGLTKTINGNLAAWARGREWWRRTAGCSIEYVVCQIPSIFPIQQQQTFLYESTRNIFQQQQHGENTIILSPTTNATHKYGKRSQWFS